jgi:hypothetical protein
MLAWKNHYVIQAAPFRLVEFPSGQISETEKLEIAGLTRTSSL